MLQAVLKNLSSKLMIALFIGVMVTFLILFLLQSLQMQKMHAENEQKKAELAVVQARTDALQEHLDFYKGPGYLVYVEKVAREALGLVKPGETVVLTVPNGEQAFNNRAATPTPATTTSTSAPVATPTAANHKSNWQNWLDFFVGN